jgi:general secretion pathway protein G
MILMKDDGFTLLELIVVVALIMILSAIGIGSYTTAAAKSMDTQRKHDLNQISKALEDFYSDTGKYPKSSGGYPLCYSVVNTIVNGRQTVTATDEPV